MVAAGVAWVPLGVFVAISLAGANSGGRDSSGGWAAHRAEIRALPESVYHHDRFRAIRGRVTDEDGKPVARALVRCVKVESLVELAKEWLPTSSGWKLPIEAEISSGQDGRYEFAHLPVGARTFFYSAPGRDLAPTIKDLIVVQDGLGAQLDVTLARPRVLRVQLGWSSIAPTPRFHLIPHRWWPEIVTVPVSRGAGSVEFRGLGGPLRKGLIAVSGSGESSPLRVIARYDLDRHENITLPRPGQRASRFDLPEAGGLEPWGEPLTPAVRLFYAAVSPIALFWVADVDIGPLRLPLDDLAESFASHSVHGTVRGFSPHPFLPVLIKSRWSPGVLTWASEGSEFEVGGLPAGQYRARAVDVFGRVTFSSGALVGPSQTSVEATQLWTKLDLDETDSREIMGFVRWESGAPVEKASVFMQNTYDFRKYVRRVETDHQGFFRFAGAPGNEPYFVFAVPPGQPAAMRNMDYFGITAFQRELWRDQVVHPHRIIGSVGDGVPLASLIQLVKLDLSGDAIIWSFRADSSGRFTVENLPHGHYRLEISSDLRGGKRAHSRPFDVVDGQAEVAVKWPEP
jgi:hypothetical protein